MGKPKPIRNPKSEMVSCIGCTVFVALIYGAIRLLMMPVDAPFYMMDYIFWTILGVWGVISVYYTVRYFLKRDKYNANIS